MCTRVHGHEHVCLAKGAQFNLGDVSVVDIRCFGHSFFLLIITSNLTSTKQKLICLFLSALM